jgi:hypothetical protein
MVNEAVAKATHQTAPTQFVEANGIRYTRVILSQYLKKGLVVMM